MEKTRERDFLCSIGLRYYEDCKDYDLGVCALRTNEGVAVPTTATERAMVNANARKVAKHLKALYGLSNSDFMKALRYARKSRGQD